MTETQEVLAPLPESWVETRKKSEEVLNSELCEAKLVDYVDKYVKVLSFVAITNTQFPAYSVTIETDGLIRTTAYTSSKVIMTRLDMIKNAGALPAVVRVVKVDKYYNIV